MIHIQFLFNFFFNGELLFVMENQSVILDFSRVADFFEEFNIKFKVADMYQQQLKSVYDESEPYDLISEGVDDAFELVLVSSCYDNIDGCLTDDGKLNTEVVSIIDTMPCSLDYCKQNYGEITIELHDNVVFDIGDVNVNLKAVFLRTADENKYVMGYSIQRAVMSVTNEVVFDDDVIFWDISRLKE